MTISKNYSYRLTISYNGAGLFGWQIQNNAPEKTIQEELNRALAKLAKSSNIKTIGSGRTDAGVHALGQVVKAEIPINIDPKGLMAGLNSLLIPSIRVNEVMPCPDSFHPIFHAKSKRYDYYFARHVDPFDREQVARFRFDLDLDLIERACQLFVGEHDFKNFYCAGTPVSSTVRTIYSCSLMTKVVDTVVGKKEYYCFSVSGSGFMKQMVRLMVGTLWNIGRGKTSLEELKRSLLGQGVEKLGIVAPSHGLYLVEVIY